MKMIYQTQMNTTKTRMKKRVKKLIIEDWKIRKIQKQEEIEGFKFFGCIRMRTNNEEGD